MKIKVSYGLVAVLVTGIGLFLCLLFPTQIGEWVSLFLGIILAILFIVALVIVIDRANRKAAKIGGVLFGLNALLLLYQLNLEYFKSPVVLQAHLDDDSGRMDLCLRENGEFEMATSYLFSTQAFTGKYQIEGDKIHFLDPPYKKDFIPPTVTIWQDKIILQFDKEGQPDLGFARYFDITDNKINNAP